MHVVISEIITFCVITLCVRKVITICVERLLHFALKILLHFASILLHFALVLHFGAILITFCVNITFCGDYYFFRRKSNNSPIQDYVHPDDQTQPTFEMTPGSKPFTKKARMDKL